MIYDPNYKLRHKPPSIRRLLYYKYRPPPMVGDPPRGGQTWDARCKAVYAAMMAEKRGEIPLHMMRGLWHWYVT
jgi:hypothetical protein